MRYYSILSYISASSENLLKSDVASIDEQYGQLNSKLCNVVDWASSRSDVKARLVLFVFYIAYSHFAHIVEHLGKDRFINRHPSHFAFAIGLNFQKTVV